MSLERELATALRSGSLEKRNEVYEAIYESYRGLLYFIASKNGIQPSLQDDLVSETFLRFFNCESKGGIQKIKPFLVAAMENGCKDYIRKKEAEELQEEVATEDAMGIVVEELRSLLGEKDFSLLYDYCVYELSSAELAAKHGSTPAAIRQRVKRLKAKARKYMED